MNKYSAAVLLVFMSLFFLAAVWLQEVKGPDALIAAIDRIGLVLMVLVGVILSIVIFFVALKFVIEFQRHDDKGEIERMKAVREQMSAMKAEAQLQQQYAKMLPSPTQAQIPAVWQDSVVDTSAFVIED
jgi:mannitol-specific phosphotransferase system IIBC component